MIQRLLPKNVNLQLQDAVSKNMVSAVSVERRDGATVPDRDSKAVPFELVSYKFAVPFGTYKIRSVNTSFPNLLGSQDYNTNESVTEFSKFGSMGAVAYGETLKFYSDASKGMMMKSVGVDGSGNIYVLGGDLQNILSSYILKLDSRGNVIGKLTGNGLFYVPSAIAVDKSGNVYVIDLQAGSISIPIYHILKFDSYGNFLKMWGTSGRNVGQFGKPSAIAVDNSGYVYVSDSKRCKILKFDANGKFMTEWGSAGSANGQFSEPNGVAVDGSGNVYIADRSQIQKFDSSGRYITKWGSFTHSASLAVDTVGQYLYMSDLQIHCVQKFSLDGEYIKTISVGKSFLGFFYSDLAVDSTTGTLHHRPHKL